MKRTVTTPPSKRSGVEIVIDQLAEPFEGSVPDLSRFMGVHRSTLHYALRRGHFSSKLQQKCLNTAKTFRIQLNPNHLIGE